VNFKEPAFVSDPVIPLIVQNEPDLGGAAKNALVFEPKIFAVGQTRFNTVEFENWIDFNQLGEMSLDTATPLGKLWDEMGDTDSIARMIEFGGRHCYRAWSQGRDRVSYIRNIMKMEHGSVMEHATINWAVQGVSRSLSLELARHRVGIALSQESQRYVDASEINFVVPPIVISMANAAGLGNTILEDFLSDNLDSVANYTRMQESLFNYMIKQDGDVKAATVYKKRANEAARALLPNDTETRFLWTTNMRILQHFLWLRGGLGADLEIRRLAVWLLSKAQQVAPEIFDTMTTKAVEGDFGVPIIVSADI